MSDSVVSELIALNQQLLDAVDQRNWAVYEELCDPSLTAFEPEAIDHLVSGLDFHYFYFQLESPPAVRQSTISSPHVRFLGDAAVVTFVRLVQKIDSEGRPISGASTETRVWQKKGETWKHVHFHRSQS